MIKEIIKPLIIGISIIVGVLIYTEQTKYVVINNNSDNDNNSDLNYFLLNRTNGEVVRNYYLPSNKSIINIRVNENGETTQNILPFPSVDLTKEK